MAGKSMTGKSMAGKSMTWRLILRLSLGLGALWLAAVAGVGLSLRGEINEVFDAALQETAQGLLTLAAGELSEEEEEDESLARRQPLPFGEHEEYIVYQVRNAEGRILLRSHEAPRSPLSERRSAGFENRGEYRIYTQATLDGRLFIHVAEEREERGELILESLSWLLLPLFALPLLAGLLVWLSVRGALGPLARVRQDMSLRGGANLEPLGDEGLPSELAPVVRDVNRLLARLKSALEAERSLAANSAHELRTPIAAALAQVQALQAALPDGAERERAGEIAAAMKRMGRLVEKLLQLSRAEAGLGLSEERFDALPVMEMMIADRTSRSGHPNAAPAIHLERGDRERFELTMDMDAFGVAFGNLLENALTHGGPGEAIEVRLAQGRLSVINGGPAVEPAALEGLRRAFERGAQAGPGTGLGLAIVESVMRQSGGALELRSPAEGRSDGFQADLVFRDRGA